jgi:hypothetical protein
MNTKNVIAPPHWQQRMVRWLAAWLYPELIADRADLLRAAKEIGAKLKATREECEEWRQRAFSAEDACRAAKQGVKDAIETHDKKHGTMLSW